MKIKLQKLCKNCKHGDNILKLCRLSLVTTILERSPGTNKCGPEASNYIEQRIIRLL